MFHDMLLMLLFLLKATEQAYKAVTEVVKNLRQQLGTTETTDITALDALC
jgi:hypothetical protein